MKIVQFRILVIIFGVSILRPDLVLSQAQTHKLIDSLINSTIEENGIPSMAVGVITKDTILYGINGTTKIKGNRRVSIKNLYHLGSTTKAFVGYVAMDLHEKGLIDIYSSIFKIIPDIKSNNNKAFHEVSVADLLSHQAYLQPYQRTQEFNKLPELEGNLTDKRKSFTKFVLSEKAVDKFTYSNAGYIIASYILEKASGKSFEVLLRNTIEGLGLSYIVGFPNREKTEEPWGHWVENDVYQALGPDHYYNGYDYSLAAGNMSMNIVNFSNWVQNHLKGLSGDPKQLSAKGYEMLHLDRDKYSYGWGNRNTENGKESMHSGSSGTFFSDVVIYHDKGIAIVMLMNTAQQNHIAALDKLHKKLFNMYSE